MLTQGSHHSFRFFARHLEQHGKARMPFHQGRNITVLCAAQQIPFPMHPRLREMVASKLILDWSPEQISGWLKTEYPDDGSMQVSHEIIYRSLFIQARGVLKKELMEHLRSKRRMRRSRHATVSGQSRGQIVDAISIRERPAEVEDRAIPGHKTSPTRVPRSPKPFEHSPVQRAPGLLSDGFAK
jgi:IS30 family transposase